jgi:DNA-binding PadR family transcriptional regulator
MSIKKVVSDTAKGEKELALRMDQWKHFVNSEADSC